MFILITIKYLTYFHCTHPKFENVALANNEHQIYATKFYICSIENDQKMD